MTAPETFALTPDGVTAALRTLDVESWEIAEKLKAAGIKGKPMDECRCALAAYIHTLIPTAHTIYVEAEHLRVEGRIGDEFGFDPWPVALSVAMPDGAQDFVQDFDRGEYPDLIEESETNA